MLLVATARAGYRIGMGEALGHLCTQRIEMAVRRVIGMDSNSPLCSESESQPGVLHQVASLRAFFEMSSTGSTAACPHQVGLACHLYRARSWSLDQHTR